jgi:hypothetical protein
VSTTNVEDIYELSPLQRGMLLHTVHDGASDMYLGQHVYIVDGPLDIDAMVRAWRLVFESHPALRTSFHWDGQDKPLQVVHRDVTPPAHQEDWSDLAGDQQRERLDRLMAEDRATGFDLTVAPLQRLHLIRFGVDQHALAWTHHHLLLDGWSVPIFMNEVMARYQSLTGGGPLPPPAPAFRDYIAWLQKQDMDAARIFWKEVLNGVTPARLAALRPLDPRRGTGGVDRHVVSLPSAIEDGLRDAAARHQVTLNTVLHAAWAVVLSRYTGSRDVVFGCVSSGRPAELPGVDRRHVRQHPARSRHDPAGRRPGAVAARHPGPVRRHPPLRVQPALRHQEVGQRTRPAPVRQPVRARQPLVRRRGRRFA